MAVRVAALIVGVGTLLAVAGPAAADPDPAPPVVPAAPADPGQGADVAPGPDVAPVVATDAGPRSTTGR